MIDEPTAAAVDRAAGHTRTEDDDAPTVLEEVSPDESRILPVPDVRTCDA